MKTKASVSTTNYVYQKENQVFLLDRENTVKKFYYPVGFNWIPFKNYNKINLWFSLLLFCGLSLFTSCDKDDDINIGSQNIATETREVGAFTKLSSTGVFEVNIAQGDSQSVEITADDNIIGRVRTNVVNGELRLELSDGNYENITLRARIIVEQLNGINNSGIGNIVASNVDSNNFFLTNSGDADITISGSSNNLDCFNEGVGDIKGFDFLVNNADLEIRGSGSIEISCTDTLDAEINGSGDVLYRGNPAVNSAIRGSGEVRKVGD
ncbi:head GIN domain-containing protein [Flagellimonas sp. 2504JD1-5]